MKSTKWVILVLALSGAVGIELAQIEFQNFREGLAGPMPAMVCFGLSAIAVVIAFLLSMRKRLS